MIVTIREEELVTQVENLSVQRLHRWIRLGLVRPIKPFFLCFTSPPSPSSPTSLFTAQAQQNI